MTIQNTTTDRSQGGAAQMDLAHMQAVLAAQKAAQVRDGVPSAALRKDRINRAITLIVNNQARFVESLRSDFGARSPHETILMEVVGSLGALKHARDHLERWIRPSKRSPEAPFGLLGAKAQVVFQPKGTVGVISPWNVPVNLTFSPLASVFAAGNRVMIKPSEFTPETSALMAELFASAYDPEEVAVFLGGPDVGQDFGRLAFDHLLFTGATSIGRHVMRAAAENLVPLTLELGGKSPAILGPSADMALAAKRIMSGKTLNAGQICIAPDYVMLPQSEIGNFVSQSRSAVAQMFPTLKDNPDYSAIISQRHYDRLQGYLADAEAKGAELVPLNPAGEDFSQQEHRRIPPTLILNPTNDMAVMQEEIFGPLLPVRGYSSISEAVAHVNAGPRPLALYYFGSDSTERDSVLSSTTSGGACVNDVIVQFGQEDLPFGGVGPSGMGCYHGHDGFLEFSHRKAVYQQIKPDLLAIIRPPYGEKFAKMMKGRLKA
jgi:coniferyl-aldehyde dehydrogenase